VLVGAGLLTSVPSYAAVGTGGSGCPFRLGAPIQTGAAGTFGFEVPAYPVKVDQTCSTTVTVKASIFPASGGRYDNVSNDPATDSVRLSFSGASLPLGIQWEWRPHCADPASPGVFSMSADGQLSSSTALAPTSCSPDLGGTSSLTFDAVQQSDPNVLVGIAATVDGHGYWTVPASGSAVLARGDASGSGFLPQMTAHVVGIVSNPTGLGYWVVASDGGVFAFGGAPFLGSLGGRHLDAPVVGMAASRDGGGYWLAGADGGVFAFGNAAFEGSLAGRHLEAPIVGMGASATGEGYRLVGADGGVFAFGNAAFEGSLARRRLNAPVVGMKVTDDGAGYWVVAADGGVFAFGDATFCGSAGDLALAAPIFGMDVMPRDDGYWLVGADGGVFAFGAAGFYGTTRLN